MRKSFFFCLAALSLLLVSSQRIYAEINSVYIGENTKFVFITPADWNLTKEEPPFDYKLVHQDKNRECYLTFSSWDIKINKEILLEEIRIAAVAKYGEEFWESPNFVFGDLTNESDALAIMSFFWNEELVHVWAAKNGEYSLHCVLLAYKDIVTSTRVFQDWEAIYKHISCFEK